MPGHLFDPPPLQEALRDEAVASGQAYEADKDAVSMSFADLFKKVSGLSTSSCFGCMSYAGVGVGFRVEVGV